MRTNNENENVNAPVGVYKCISEKGGRSKRACEDVIQIKKVFLVHLVSRRNDLFFFWHQQENIIAGRWKIDQKI